MWKIARGNLDNVNGKTVFTAKDEVSKNVIDTYLSYLSGGIVNMFQTEVICLGGGVFEAEERILELIQNAIKENAFVRFGKRHTQMKIASLGNDAGIIGAALLWKDTE